MESIGIDAEEFNTRMLLLNDLSLKWGESLLALKDAIHSGSTNATSRENILELISDGTKVKEEYINLFKGNEAVAYLVTEKGSHEDSCARAINKGVFGGGFTLYIINTIDKIRSVPE